MTRLEKVTHDLQIAHKYTDMLIETIPQDRWLEQPKQGITHTAWQVAHLAYAEYALIQIRVFGKNKSDESILTQEFRKQYGKGSTPDPNPEHNLTPAEILSACTTVFENSLSGLNTLPTHELDAPSLPEHPMFSTKFGAIDWCVHHTYIHAGQIALLRRLLGLEPLR